MTEEMKNKERVRLLKLIIQYSSEMDEITNSGKSNVFKSMRLKKLRSKVESLEKSYLDLYGSINYDDELKETEREIEK